GIPVLGICYGMQIASKSLGARIRTVESREYGRTRLDIKTADQLLKDLPEQTTVWMSHGDQVNELSDDFIPLAATPSCPVAAARHKTKPFHGVQFHPEVTHTPQGKEILNNFLFSICKCQGQWQMSDFVKSAAKQIRARVGDKKVICGLS